MRKLISLFAALILTVHMTSCTSKDSKDDASGDEAVAAETAGTDAELEALDAPPAKDAKDSAVAGNSGANEGFLDDQLPEDALGEKTAKSDPAPTADSVTSSATPPPAMEEPKAESKADPLADAGFDPPIESAPAPDNSMAAVDPGTSSMKESSSSEAPSMDSGSSASSASSYTPPAESKPKATLQKVEATPILKGKVLLNAVYVARPGDNYKKISKMIYGDASKEKELKKANAVSKPKPGDKIYYNSPVRPTDDTKVLTYYEDAGISPEVYVAQEGDDLKKVAKKVLGYDNAWKEIWATNTVDSKGALTAGTELRYWKTAPSAPKTEVAAANGAPNAGAAGSVAANEVAPPPMPDMPPAPPAEMAPPPPPPAQMAPPPPPPVAQNDIPPPPPAQMNPPPPPPAEMAPPPPPSDAVNPPPPPPVAKKSEPAIGEEGLDQNMIMTLAGVGIVALGAFALIISRKRRQSRDAAVAFNDTHVGT